MLKKTTKNFGKSKIGAAVNKLSGKEGHDHMAYIRPDGSGVTSVDEGHSHEISQVFEFQVVPQVDPGTGQPLINPETGQPVMKEEKIEKLDELGNPIYEISEVNGHTHELTDIIFSEKKKDPLSDPEKVRDTLRLYSVAKTHDSKYIAQAKVADDFYMDDQWKESVVADLRSKNRASITVNEIKSKIDLLSGYQRQNRTDIKFFPTEDGDSRISDILTKLVKNITEQSNYAYEETSVFDDEVITGRGNFHVYIDLEDNLDSDIKVEKFNWSDVVYGPHDKKDGSDCEYIVKQKWFSRAAVEAMYPDKADEVRESFNFLRELKGDSSSFDDNYSSGTTKEIVDTVVTNIDEMVNIEQQNIRVFELLKNVYKRVPIVFNKGQNFYFNAELLESKDLSQVKTIEELTVVPKKFTDIMSYTVTGNILLDSAETIFKSLPLVPTYATKRGPRVLGKVALAIGLQQEINKRHCQTIDFANKMYNAGWLYQEGAFVGDQLAKFKANCSKIGFVLKAADITKVQKLEGMKYPAELVALQQITSEKMAEVMGINPALIGNLANAPAISQQEQKRQGLIGNEYLFDNLSLSKKRLGKLLVEAISAVYTPQRVFRILNKQATERPQDALQNPQTGQQYTLEDIIDIWTEADLTRYDVVVGENIHSLTNRQAEFALWGNILPQSGLPPTAWLPFYIGLSDAPGKEEFLQSISQQQATEQEEVNTTAQLQLEASKSDAEKNIKFADQAGLTLEQSKELGLIPQSPDKPPA